MSAVAITDHDAYAARRWVTLAASTLASLCCGFFYAWSVLVKPMMDSYGWSPGSVSFAFTLVVGVPALCTLLAGKLLQYMRPTTLLLMSGAILGAGVVLLSFATNLALLYLFAFISGVGGMAYPGATMTNLMRFFPDKKGMASGILTAGFGLGAVIWGPVTVLLVEQMGYKWTLRVLGVLFFVIIAICSRVMSIAPPGYEPRGWRSPVGHSISESEAELPGLDWKAMLKTRTFWLLAVLFVLGLVSGMMVTGHASPIAQQMLGISAEAAGAFVSYLAIGMVIGKIGWGVLSDRFGRSPILVVILALAVLGLLLLWQTTSYAPVVIGIFVVGLCYGGFLALIGPVTLDAFGPRHFAVNFGVMFWTLAVASFVGPRLAASVAQANDGEYTQAFLVAAVLTVVGLVLSTVYAWHSRRHRPLNGRERTSS